MNQRSSLALSENETLTDSVVAAGRVPFRPCARPKKRTNRSTRTRIEHSPTKRLILFTCAAAAILSAGASLAQATEVGNSRNFGLGFQLGEPTAITAKAFLGRAHAMDFGLGFGGLGYGYCRDNNGNGYRCNDLNHDLSLHADYLYQDNIVNMTNRLDWYAGFGGRVIMWAYGSNNLAHDVVVIARIPIGIAASFWRPDFLEAYLEIVPGIAVFPLGFNIDFGLGVRAFF